MIVILSFKRLYSSSRFSRKSLQMRQDLFRGRFAGSEWIVVATEVRTDNQPHLAFQHVQLFQRSAGPERRVTKARNHLCIAAGQAFRLVLRFLENLYCLTARRCLALEKADALAARLAHVTAARHCLAHLAAGGRNGPSPPERLCGAF